ALKTRYFIYVLWPYDAAGWYVLQLSGVGKHTLAVRRAPHASEGKAGDVVERCLTERSEGVRPTPAWTKKMRKQARRASVCLPTPDNVIESHRKHVTVDPSASHRSCCDLNADGICCRMERRAVSAPTIHRADHTVCSGSGPEQSINPTGGSGIA